MELNYISPSRDATLSALTASMVDNLTGQCLCNSGLIRLQSNLWCKLFDIHLQTLYTSQGCL